MCGPLGVDEARGAAGDDGSLTADLLAEKGK
jgi:hypothetical protein